MTEVPVHDQFGSRSLRWAFVVAAIAALVLSAVMSAHGLDRLGAVELETRSDYSQIRIRKRNNVRTMSFVRDSGEEVVESQVNLDRPHDLLVTYTRYMFLSYLFRPKVQRVLIVGLGGGAMVQFLKHHDPEVQVDVVEIDPVIVRLADRYFGVRSDGNVTIVTADAFVYLAETRSRYDVIYMDAFLKPSADTDKTGVPLRLKTERFYKDLQEKLSPDGLVVFNLNPHAGVRDDVATIEDVFPQGYLYRMPDSQGLVMVASRAQARETATTLAARAVELDRRLGATFSFRDMARRLER